MNSSRDAPERTRTNPAPLDRPVGPLVQAVLSPHLTT